MSINWETHLVAAIVDSEDPPAAYQRVVELGVKKETLGTPEGRLVWDFITKRYEVSNNYGTIPSRDLIAHALNGLELPKAKDDIVSISEIVLEQHIQRRMDDVLAKYESVKKKKGALAALTYLTGAAEEVQNQGGVNGSKDVIWGTNVLDETLEEMDTIETTDGLTGLPWPWAPMNKATGGIQPGDFLLFWGIPKSMKTWLGLVVAAYLFERGHKVLIYSAEMLWPKIRQRLACLLAKIDYGRYKSNELSEREKERLLTTLEDLTERFSGNLVFTDLVRPDGTAGGVTDLRRKINLYNPDFILLDSSYMLDVPGKDAMDWKALGAITRACKQVSKATLIPTLAIIQENEKNALKYKGTRGTASIGQYAGVVQDCDLGVKVVKNQKLKQISLIFSAARDTTFAGFSVHAHACENFTVSGMHLFEVGDGVDDGEDGSGDPSIPRPTCPVEGEEPQPNPDEQPAIVPLTVLQGGGFLDGIQTQVNGHDPNGHDPNGHDPDHGSNGACPH